MKVRLMQDAPPEQQQKRDVLDSKCCRCCMSTETGVCLEWASQLMACFISWRILSILESLAPS
jgi:hypothetical protein